MQIASQTSVYATLVNKFHGLLTRVIVDAIASSVIRHEECADAILVPMPLVFPKYFGSVMDITSQDHVSIIFKQEENKNNEQFAFSRCKGKF